MLEQTPKSSQFPDSLLVRSGDDGSAAEKQPPHVFGNGESGCRGLPDQFFVFPGGKSERPPPLKSVCRLPFSICLSCLLESVRSAAPNALLESRGAAFGRFVAGVRQLPTCKEELPTRPETASSLFRHVFTPCFFSFAASIAEILF